MRTINTSENGWQQELESCMRQGVAFRLLTDNAALMQALKTGKMNWGALKFFLLGVGTGVSGGVAASQIVALASVSNFMGVMSVVDPEPISKTILATVSAVAASIGAYYLCRMVETFVKERRAFRIIQQTDDGGWIIEAEAAQPEEGEDVVTEE